MPIDSSSEESINDSDKEDVGSEFEFVLETEEDRVEGEATATKVNLQKDAVVCPKVSKTFYLAVIAKDHQMFKEGTEVKNHLSRLNSADVNSKVIESARETEGSSPRRVTCPARCLYKWTCVVMGLL